MHSTNDEAAALRRSIAQSLVLNDPALADAYEENLFQRTEAGRCYTPEAMKAKQPQAIYPRTCVRCGHGPFIPRKLDSVDCPACHMPHNTQAVRHTRPAPKKKGTHAKKRTQTGAVGKAVRRSRK